MYYHYFIIIIIIIIINIIFIFTPLVFPPQCVVQWLVKLYQSNVVVKIVV